MDFARPRALPPHEHLTPKEVEHLIEAARQGDAGQRGRASPLMYPHRLRLSGGAPVALGAISIRTTGGHGIFYING
jgi:hypothetical protein